jgi:pSer/pThr/pTyr-binding forkhead associated (FHA) protein
MAKSLSLEFLNGPRVHQSVLLTPGEICVGRSHGCNIVLDDPLVSRRHLLLTVTSDAVMAKDQNTSHGTFLNEERLRGAVSLADGDTLQIGATRLRFAVREQADEMPSTRTRPDIVPAAAPASSDASRTRFAGAAVEGETQYVEPAAARQDGDAEPQDATRVLEAQETRMLEKKELRGVSAKAPSASRARTPLVGFVALLLAAIVAAALYAAKSRTSQVSNASSLSTYAEPQFGFSISYPSTWTRTTESMTSSNAPLLRFVAADTAGKRVAWLDIHAERRPSHLLTGLTTGFDAYGDVLHARYPAFQLLGTQPMDIGGVKVIFYVFQSGETVGKGIYTLSGEARIVVEAACQRPYWKGLAGGFTDILGSFGLDAPQNCLDFPKPDEQMRRMALGHADEMVKQAQQHLKVGEDLFTRQNVRPENLYRAMAELKQSLRICAAFVTRPECYGQAAALLVKAKQEYEHSVKDQRFAIAAAIKRQDRKTAYWEAYKLLQMIPDKADPVYQEAYAVVERCSDARR